VAVVGEAHILVRAITTGVQGDIQRAFRGLSGEGGSARKSGESLGAAFSRGFSSSSNANVFSKLANAIGTMAPNADSAAASFSRLSRVGITTGTAVSVLIGAIGSLVASLGSLGSAAIIGAGSLFSLVGAFVSLRIGAAAASFALSGISAAFGRATSAQGGLGVSLKEINKQFKELQRNAESAAMSEKRAGLELEKARNNLLRMQDLPPNNMARREAQQALEEAELNYRQAKERSKDLNDELAKGKDGITEALGGGVDPYAGLTKSQRAFAEYLVTLKPKFDELKEAVAKGFLPLLRTQLERIMDGPLFPVIKTGLEGIGTSLGIAAQNFTDFLVSADGVRKIELLFANARPVIEKFGTILGKVFDGFLGMLEYAQPLVINFMDYLDGVATSFQEFFNPDTEAGKKGLTDFFAEIERVATQFEAIFGNIFTGIGEVVKANTGPGSGADILMEGLKSATASFAALDGSATGKGSLRQYFIDVANNVKPLMGLLGDMANGLLQMGANPALGDTFTKLREAGPELSEMLGKMIEAGPNLAELFTNVLKIINAFTDSEASKIFFDTINIAAKTLADVLQNETVKGFLDVIGRIFAFTLALGFLKNTFSFFGNVILGNLKNISGGIGAAFAFFKPGGGFDGVRLSVMYFFDGAKVVFGKFATFMMTTVAPKIFAFGAQVYGVFVQIGGAIATFAGKIALGIKTIFMANPAGFIIGIIAAIVAALAFFFTQTEMGKKIWADFTKAVGDLLTGLGKLFSDIVDGIGDAWDGFVSWIKKSWEDWVRGFKLGVEGLGKAFKDVWEGGKSLFKDVMNFFISRFEGFVNGAVDGINTIIKGLNFVGKHGPIKFQIQEIPRLKIPRLAKGGVVMPSTGGSLVNVAEAGRAERIEPLDENGLSKRDKALISALSGGSGGGATINVYPSAGMDERELANMVSRRIAFEIRKGAF
jgi:hypothetical protein